MLDLSALDLQLHANPVLYTQVYDFNCAALLSFQSEGNRNTL